MILQREKIYIYELILAEIRAKIEGGEYLPGDRIDSIAELQKGYAIGRNTAIRIIEELEKSGLAIRKKGKGTFINTLRSINDVAADPAPIEKIILYLNSIKAGPESFAGKIFEGIYARIEELKIDFRMEYKNLEPGRNQIKYLPFQIGPGEGLITLFIYKQPNLLLQQLLAGLACRCVLIDGVFPGVHSVLTDNYEGMALLINYLQEAGHRKIAYAEPRLTSGFYFNLNERREAFLRITKGEGLDATIITPGSYEGIYQACCAPIRPSAIIFPVGDAAVNSVNYLRGKGLAVPEDISICSFGNWLPSGKGAEGLTAVREDSMAMGRQAVDLLMTPGLAPERMSAWKRIAPRLIMGSTVKNLN